MKDNYKAIYDYDAQQNDELSLKVGDMVHILQRNGKDWCTAENIETGQIGAAPISYLEMTGHYTSSTSGVNVKDPVLAKVLQNYAAQDPEELTLQKGGIVTVLDQSFADGWWKGDLNGVSGVFPANHVELIDTQQKRSPDATDAGQRQSFKLAAYGVKQGGIGSILAGGFNLRKNGHKKDELGLDQAESTHEQQGVIGTKGGNTGIKSADECEKAMVINQYHPENDDELELLPGAYVTIIDKMDDQGWWKGMNENNDQGIFPSNFVQVISQETIPARPARARPPTILTDSHTTSTQKTQQSLVSPTGMAKPPPVPIGTRPSSLLTQRPNTNDHQTTSTPAPAPRPITSPPVPSRRVNSVIKDINQPRPQPQHQSHKRTPSIPMTSPDLPPIRHSPLHEQHPVRPSRPVPSPGSTTSSSSLISPISPTSEDKIIGLAKVPKIFGKNQSGPATAPPRSPRPNSLVSSTSNTNNSLLSQESANEPKLENDGEVILSPRAPKRSMPSVPPRHHQQHHSRESSNGSIDKHKDSPTTLNRPQTPSSPIPSSPTTNSFPSVQVEDDLSTTDPLETMLRQWFKDEAGLLRQEFESQLEEERSQRLKLEAELELLKRQLA
ncbi:SH3 domain-containing protein [Chlamydoabsidia padenii]|nr:SH3 domain-containing protein [Chlamydoabsidia padenii]